MKTLLWIVVGVAIGLAAWIPLNMSDPRDIPFGEAILGLVGTLVGGIIVIVAAMRWIRRGPVPR